ESDHILVCSFLANPAARASQCCEQSRREVAAIAKRHVSDLSCSGVYFDQVRIFCCGLENKVKAVQTRKPKSASHSFGCGRHILVFDQPQHGRGTSLVLLMNDLKVQAGQDLAIPTSNRARGIPASNKGLNTYGVPQAKE